MSEVGCIHYGWLWCRRNRGLPIFQTAQMSPLRLKSSDPLLLFFIVLACRWGEGLLLVPWRAEVDLGLAVYWF